MEYMLIKIERIRLSLYITGTVGFGCFGFAYGIAGGMDIDLILFAFDQASDVLLYQNVFGTRLYLFTLLYCSYVMLIINVIIPWIRAAIVVKLDTIDGWITTDDVLITFDFIQFDFTTFRLNNYYSTTICGKLWKAFRVVAFAAVLGYSKTFVGYILAVAGVPLFIIAVGCICIEFGCGVSGGHIELILFPFGVVFLVQDLIFWELMLVVQIILGLHCTIVILFYQYEIQNICELLNISPSFVDAGIKSGAVTFKILIVKTKMKRNRNDERIWYHENVFHTMQNFVHCAITTH